jgi:hypothetical protein
LILWEAPAPEEKADGLCDPPGPERTIQIKPTLRQRRMLETLIDEGIHACMWDLDNDAVDECSASIAEFLWRCGYRRTKEGA